LTGFQAPPILTAVLKTLTVFMFAVAATAQTPTVTGVINAYAGTTQLCPGLLAEIIGANFVGDASKVNVSVGAMPAYVTFVGASEIAVEIPFGAPLGATALTVTVSGVASAPFGITLAAYAPGLDPATPSQFVDSAVGIPSIAAPARPGDTLTIYAEGLGSTNPASPTGPTTVVAPTATAPTMTVGGVAAKVLFSGLVPSQSVLYQVNFTAPTGVQGTQPVVLTIGGVNSNSVTLPVAGITDLVSNARNYNSGNTSFGSPGTAAPGSIVTVFANGLGTLDETASFPAASFQGIQVTFNGTPAPLFHLIGSPSQQQIDLYVPAELPTSGAVNVQLTTSAAVYPNYTLNMVPAFPGLYRIADPNVSTRFNVIAQFNGTSGLAMPASMAAGLNLTPCSASLGPYEVCGQPAAVGDYLVLWVTGLGVTTPNGDPNGIPIRTGAIPPGDGSVLYETPTKPTVTVGGIPVAVLYSGLAPGLPGEYQIDFQVPSGVLSSDDVPVVVTMDGIGDTATISIQPKAN
jgi:uncharacterized protein (TIGR03437 family)